MTKFNDILKVVLEAVVEALDDEPYLSTAPPVKQDIQGNVFTGKGELLLSNFVDVNDPSTYGIIQQNLKEKGDEIKQLQDLVNVDTSTFNGNAATATTASNLASNAWNVPSNLGNDAVLNLKTTRPYEWRIRNRDNGKTGELSFEFYNASTQGWECKFRLYGDSRNADLSAPGINYNTP